MSKETLEKYQIWLYLMALLLGGLIGSNYPTFSNWLEQGIWIALGLLLYTTFCQVPLIHLRQACRHRRFMMALTIANFAILPVIVWLLAHILLNDPKLQFGVFLVLLVPCTDWFLTFTYLGKGNLQLAVASTPILLLFQSLLLPVYLWLFTDGILLEEIDLKVFINAFLELILLPLGLALLTEQWGKMQTLGTRWLLFTSWLPVPLLALTLLLIATSQVQALSVQSLMAMGPVVGIFVAFLFINAHLSRWVGHWFGLETDVSRTLAFSLGTRNSFVILPFALALPDSWSVVVTIVVLQPLVELTGMIAYLWWIPQKLFKD